VTFQFGEPAISCSANRKKLVLAIGLALSVPAVSADFPAELELSNIAAGSGAVLDGASTADEAGTSVSLAGDINDDGIDDLVIGAPNSTTTGAFAGISYLLLGTNQGPPNHLDLSTLDGASGTVINGESIFDASGASVSTAGDINGDGIDDLIIGAPGASPNVGYSGASYVVFGDDQGLPSPLNLSAIDGSNGIVFNGEGAYDESGASVSAAGDINGDGIADLIIGAPYASGGNGAGYVVFGSDEAWTSPVNLSGLDGSSGFRINSAGGGDTLGASVSAAGDINGDGMDDLLIGATLAGTPAAYNGASYVVFGSDEAWPSSINLSTLDGSSGVVIRGVNPGDETGTSVGAAGDVNGDGIDDLIIGSPLADPNGDDSGSSYIVFGSGQPWTSPFDLSGLNGSNGFSINGVAAGDRAGTSVSFAGDFNTDGFADVIIGAPLADPNGADSGASYVVFGSNQVWPASIELSSLDGTGGFVLNGVKAGDQSGGSVSTAGDINNNGVVDLVTGARLADPGGNNSGACYVVYVELVDMIFTAGFE